MLSGGGIKVVALVGSIKVLHEKGLDKTVKEYCGVSAGAWMAFMLACKIPVEVLERLIMELDFGVIRNVSPDAILGFPETFGLDDGSKFIKLSKFDAAVRPNSEAEISEFLGQFLAWDLA
jgi:predicted acylesterase/phospholipase RssA